MKAAPQPPGSTACCYGCVSAGHGVPVGDGPEGHISAAPRIQREDRSAERFPLMLSVRCVPSKKTSAEVQVQRVSGQW